MTPKAAKQLDSHLAEDSGETISDSVDDVVMNAVDDPHVMWMCLHPQHAAKTMVLQKVKNCSSEPTHVLVQDY